MDCLASLSISLSESRSRYKNSKIFELPLKDACFQSIGRSLVSHPDHKEAVAEKWLFGTSATTLLSMGMFFLNEIMIMKSLQPCLVPIDKGVQYT